jgi:hypothetical protein
MFFFICLYCTPTTLSLVFILFFCGYLCCLFVAAVLEKHRAGQLIPLLNDAGAIANNSAQL